MALQLPGVPFKLDAQDMGVPDWSGSLLKGLQVANKGVESYYKPRQQQADIFSKEIGPLAALASNPNFTGFNPEIQKMIAGRIGSYLSGNHGNQSFNSGETTPGYASDENTYNRVVQGSKTQFGPKGRTTTVMSRVAGEADRLGAPEWLVNLLGGRTAANSSASYDQAIAEAEHRLVMKGYSPQAAHSIMEHKPGEDENAYAARLKPLFIAEPTNQNTGNQSSRNEDALQAQSNDLSGEIRQRFHVDVPPTVLFNALYTHKGGKFNVQKWLQQNGYLR